MMMNFFSIFDPSTSLNYSLNWLSSISIILFIPNMYWFIPSRWLMLYMILIKFLINELN